MQKMFFSSRNVAIPTKKLLLLSLDWTRPKDPPLSLGHASIIAHLKQHGVSPNHQSWSVNNSHFNCLHVIDYIMTQRNQPDVAIGAFVWNEPHVQEIIKTLKKERYPGKIILGGPQISYTNSHLETYYPNADIFIRGYAEEALLALTQATQPKPIIKGVHYAGDPDLGLTATTNIEQLASPYLTGVIQPQPFLRWETQRGCPFRCSFCQHREPNIAMQRRQLNKTRILQEIDWIIQHPIINDIAVLDPTFNSGPDYMAILQTFLDKGYKGKLSLQCRIEMCRKPFLDVVEELNKTANVTLEFGLQTAIKQEQKLIQRPNNMKLVRSILEETHKRDIPTEVSLIFGLPNQTLASFIESVNFCKSFQVPVIYAFPLMLLRGTPLYDQKKQLGLVESSDIDIDVPRIQQHIPHVIASPTFSHQEWLEMAAIAESLDSYNKSNNVMRMKSSDDKMQNTLQHTLWKP